MNQTIGWALAVLAIAVGYAGYGWRGVVLGVTVIVFVLLLQFSRTLRVLRGAAQSPVGHVPSAVMLNSKLQRGLRMADVIALTRSLGTQVAEQPCAAPGGRLPRGGPELWAWRDDGGSTVTLRFEDGRLVKWDLARPQPDVTDVADGAPADPGA